MNIPLPLGTTDEGLHFIVDRLILPILDEFKPDLIINSAGQDNHFSDPLANMSMTAQGYARFNEKLRPDIAVLEGGYAIETALPYVNTGIILAMAGLDYSHVVEPDYAPGMFSLSAVKKAEITEVVEKLWDIWKHRNDNNFEALKAKQDFWQRQKFVFYDTDGIKEQQTERLRLCRDCGGYLSIVSQAMHQTGNINNILGLSIPFQGCRVCREEAYAEYERAVKRSTFDFIYLQDRAEDLYKVHSREKGTEWEEE